MSNTLVNRFAFRIALPAVMLVVLFLMLNAAGREQRAWIMQRERAHQRALTGNDIASLPFVLPFQHNPRIQDAIGLQWPAFAMAGIVAPVPHLFYAQRVPSPLTSASYVALLLVVGIYWFVIAIWADIRLIQGRRPSHSRLVRVTLTVMFVVTCLFLALFLAKDLLGGWPEGPQGAYGVTGWLALVCIMLLIEMNGFRGGLRSGSEL